MKIIRAQSESIENINILIQKSKSFWNYPKSYLEAAIPLLMVDESYLNENTAFEIRMSEDLVGFFAFALKGTEVYLDHLWIEPSKINLGIGRHALLFTEIYARENCWLELFTCPDPPAEGFYARNGFLDTGQRSPSRIDGGPQFSVFRRKFGNGDLNVRT
ncbi:MAG: GNAT family N-acetyltransferase [Deltaproteobacteria bacterium]|nr:GNAT family N-acetyltransferase [Deltaproteobacteria bacterium]